MDNCKYEDEIKQLRIELEIQKQKTNEISNSITELKGHIENIYKMIDSKISKLIYWILGFGASIVVCALGVILALVFSK